MYYTFIGDIPDEWKRMTEQYNIANGITDPNERYRFEKGGIIPTMQIGGGFDFNQWYKDETQSDLQRRAKESGRSVKEQKAGERKLCPSGAFQTAGGAGIQPSAAERAHCGAGKSHEINTKEKGGLKNPPFCVLKFTASRHCRQR